MPASRHFETVVFDVRDSANFLFFANTTDSGDIEDYLLIMRSLEPEFEGAVFVETNEEQVSADETLQSATLGSNILTLTFGKPVKLLDNETVLTLTFADSKDNRSAIEVGAFKVLGEHLTGGHA